MRLLIDLMMRVSFFLYMLLHDTTIKMDVAFVTANVLGCLESIFPHNAIINLALEHIKSSVIISQKDMESPFNSSLDCATQQQQVETFSSQPHLLSSGQER